MLPLIALLTFATVFLGTLSVARPRENPLRRRVLAVGGADGELQPARPQRLQGSLLRRVVVPVTRRLGSLVGRLLPQDMLKSAERLLLEANEPWSLAGFLGITALSTAFGIAFFAYTVVAMGASGMQAFLLALVILPLTAMLPLTRVQKLAKQRKKAIVRALPDGMDLLVTSVEAGLGVDAAFALVAEKTRGPLSETFTLYLRQVALGRPRAEALMYVAERSGVPDLIRVARSVNQGTALETPVGDVLRVQADELRVARRQRAQVAAQRAPVLMTIPLALCFLPATAAVVIVPSMMNFVQYIGDLGG